MSGAHAHDHAGHAHGGGGANRNRRRLAIALALAGTYMVAELVGGLVTNSLALLADAGHMLSDVAALGLSLFAISMAQRPPTSRRTYGYHRTEILAALGNGATLVAIAIYIFVEAWHRFREPPEVQGSLMMGIAAGGMATNLIGLWILNAGRSESLNVRGAWLHVATDALGSVGAMLAGALIYFLGLYWADPAVSVLIALLVLYSSWSLLKETVAVLMEDAPAGIDVDEVRAALWESSGVIRVHDLHVWSITTGMTAMSAHVCVNETRGAGEVLAELRERLHDRFGIDHVTIQTEPLDFAESGSHD